MDYSSTTSGLGDHRDITLHECPDLTPLVSRSPNIKLLLPILYPRVPCKCGIYAGHAAERLSNPAAKLVTQLRPYVYIC